MKTSDQLIERVGLFKSGKTEEFTSIYEESYKYLHTCIIHIVKDEDIAQDMLQDTYVEICRNVEQLKKDEDFLSWAAVIANRKCFAYLKKNRDVLVNVTSDENGEGNDFFESVADDESFIPENIFDNAEKIRIIRDIIDGLSDVQRACVISFYYNEQKQDEIAGELGIPVNTVKSHLNRAKSKIKEAVGDVEKKQGIKLYSFSTFMLMLLSYEVKNFGEMISVPPMGTVLKETVTSGNRESGAAESRRDGTKAIDRASSSLKIKIAIGAAAAVAVVAVVIGIVSHNKTADSLNQETVADTADAAAGQEDNLSEVQTEEPEEEEITEAEVTDTASEETEDIPEEPVPDAEANNVEFVDRIATDNPAWVIFTEKEDDTWHINPDPDCTYKDANAYMEVTDVSVKDVEDGNKEYTITFTQDVSYVLRYPTSYEDLYHFVYLKSLNFYDYYTGRRLNVTETSMDVGEMEKEGEIENIITWDGKEYPVTIRVQKDRENRYGDETEADGFYETTCIPFITFTYTVTCPKDYDGLCAYIWKLDRLPSDAEERNRKANYDENGKAIEKTDPVGESYVFKDEDPDGGVPTAEDLYMMRI